MKEGQEFARSTYEMNSTGLRFYGDVAIGRPIITADDEAVGGFNMERLKVDQTCYT